MRPSPSACVYVAELVRPGRLASTRHWSSGTATVLGRVGLPTGYAGASFEELHAAMKVDKKSRGDQLRFVVLDDLARAARPRRPVRGAPPRRRTTAIGGDR